MRGFFRSFYWKISAIFLVLLLILGVVLIFPLVHFALEFSTELDQKQNQYLARDLAVEFKKIMERFPPPKSSLDFDATIDTVFPHFTGMNPTVKIYLLDDEGNIRAPLMQKLMFRVELSQFKNFTQAFASNEISLSQRVDILMTKKDKEWRIIDKDNDRMYIARKGKDSFYFYEGVQRWKVDVEPVKQFIVTLGQRNTLEKPIYGDHPLSRHRQNTFSAAEISIIEPMYLYVVLDGERHDSIIAAVKENFNRVTVSSILQIAIGNQILVFIFIGIIGLVLFFLLTKHLREMTTVVRKFERGDFRQRIAVKSNSEIDQLGIAFNEMASTIVANMDALKENDRLRRELIANISHDLRTPLTSIQGYLETILMKESVLSPEARRRFLETSLSNVTMLIKLVEELFELSKLDGKQTQPNLEPFSIAELTQDVVLKFQPQAEQRQIKLSAILPQNLPFVYGDIGMIDRALSNLIDNAIYYTSDEGVVVVELMRVADKVQVRISDTGCGIPAEELPRIFDRFYRVEKGRSRFTGGAGLGLAIVHKIMEAHEIQISVKSTVGVGTTFSFNLQIFQKN